MRSPGGSRSAGGGVTGAVLPDNPAERRLVGAEDRLRQPSVERACGTLSMVMSVLASTDFTSPSIW